MKSACIPAIALTILIFTFSSNNCFAQDETSLLWAKNYHFEPGEVFPIEIGAFGYPFVECELNGSSIVMLFDTGNITGVFIRREVAQQLGLKKIGESGRRDSSGNSVGTFAVYNARDMSAFGKKWKDVKILERNEERFQGAIGPKYVMKGRFTIDYINRFIGVSDSPTPGTGIDHCELELLPNESYPGMIVVKGSVNGRLVLIQFDTGKSRSVVDPLLVKELNLLQDEHGALIKEIKLGSRSFSVKSAKVLSLAGLSRGYPEPILLGIGSDIISQMVLSVDYQRKIVRIGS